MRVSPHRLLFLGLLLVVAQLRLAAAPEEEAAQRWRRHERQFQAFAEEDRAHAPRPGGILLVGSSIFRHWTTAATQLAPLPVLNRAFGGSRTTDQLARFEQVVTPYAPKIIVYYCGSNDINAGRTATGIAANFRAFVERVHAGLPRTRILYASILRAPQKRERWHVVDEANALIRDYCATEPRLGFIDLNPAVFDRDGRPRLELYLEDELHYQPQAYDGFEAIIRPVLERAWREVEERSPAADADTGRVIPPGETFVYKRTGDEEVALEVYFPPNHATGAGRAPALLLFHGGGWRSGSRAKLREACVYFSSRGMVAATADYRKHSRDARLPAGESFKRICITDAKSAIRWMKRHAADLGIDPQRLVVGGGSAGAHIAMLATINPGLDDPADPPGFDTTVAAYVLFNPAFASRDSKDFEVDALAHLPRDLAPAIVLFGTEDRWLKGWSAVHQRLRALGNTAIELWTAKGGTHGFYLTPPWRDLTLAAADRFLGWHGLLTGETNLPPAVGGEKLEKVPQPVPLHGWEDRLGWSIRMNRGPEDAWGDLPTALRLLRRGGVSDDAQHLYAAAYGILVANPEATFADLSRNEAFRRICSGQDRVLLGGPMLGGLHEGGAQVWVRTVMPAAVSVVVQGDGGEKVFGPARSSRASDLAAVVTITGLSPATTYSYRLLVDGREVPMAASAQFTTAARAGTPGKTRIIFGGDFHRWGFAHAPIMDRILEHNPIAMLQVGDLAAQDRFTHVGLHRADYLLRDLFPAWQRLAARMPLYAVWDDHDYLANDLSGLPARVTLEQRHAVWSVFRHAWNNPAYGFGEDRGGLFLHTTINDIDVIMLDTRYFREKPPHGSMLGAEQMAWLEAELENCHGRFIILSSGTMWTDHVTGGKDSWGQFSPEERERIFSLIERKRIGGVLLIAGDRHGACGYRIPRPSGFAFHEFEVGSLGGISGKAAPAARAPDADGTLLYRFGEGYAFGEFIFDTTLPDPRVTFRLVRDDDRVLYELMLSRSRLTP